MNALGRMGPALGRMGPALGRMRPALGRMHALRGEMRIAFALIAALALFASASAYAAACPRTSLADVEDEVMCPVCGVPLGLATEAPQAQRQREFIQREVQSCKSKEQIKTALVAQFGERVLALPPEKGFNLAVYLVPAAVVAAGAAGIGLLVLRRRRPSSAEEPEERLDVEDAARLEDDLARYDL